MMAKSALAAREYAQVRALADSILRIKPHHLTAREYLLEALVALEQSEEACDQSLEIYRLHLESEEFESAEKALKFVIERRPSTPEPRRLLVVPENLRVSAPRKDDLDPKRQLVELRFDLPRGSYGTLIVKRLFRG